MLCTHRTAAGAAEEARMGRPLWGMTRSSQSGELFHNISSSGNHPPMSILRNGFLQVIKSVHGSAINNHKKLEVTFMSIHSGRGGSHTVDLVQNQSQLHSSMWMTQTRSRSKKKTANGHGQYLSVYVFIHGFFYLTHSVWRFPG